MRNGWRKVLAADGDISSHFETNGEHYSPIFFFGSFVARLFSSKEVNWLKVAPRLPPPFILILWLYTKARKAIRTINGHQFQLHIHLSAISSLAFAARARVVVVMVRIRKQSRGMHHFLSSPNYLSHFSCSHQQVGTLFLLRIVVLCDMKTRKTRLINLQFFVLPPTLYFCSSILVENCGGRRLKVSHTHSITHMLSFKNIFVQEGKNRTLIQSCNHAAVRNVIIQFFGRPPPLGYVFKFVWNKKSQECQELCEMDTKTTRTAKCLLCSQGTTFSSLML